MKYLASCLLALPLITSCMEQNAYYEPNYYNPASRVEVQRSYPANHHREYYRPAPQGRASVAVNPHRAVVNPRTPQRSVEAHHQAHGPGENNSNHVVRHAPTGGAIAAQGKMHGHDPQVHGKPQQTIHAHEGMQETTHGHD